MPSRQIDSYPIWHPFTQMKTAGVPLRVQAANAEFLTLEDGRSIIDCISSWWVTLHGHGNRQIAAAIYEQACKLEHVIFAGFTHEPAEKLAASLLSQLPATLSRVFFSDDGSTSVEVALKMVLQYWQNCGQEKRRRLIGFAGGYHGDTLGAMSAGGSSSFWRPFADLLFDIDVVDYPQTWEHDDEVEHKEEATLARLEELLEQGQGVHAAIIIEPLVQGAAGMRMCRPQFLTALRSLADRHGALLIFDEVMTGFGRTGDWFACTKSGATPDIICLSKGITGGALPLAVTISSEQIYQAFLSDKLERALFHSHSYTGNPIACAAANASFALLEESASVFRSFENRHRALAAEYFSDGELVHKIRFGGTIAAFDLQIGDCNYYSGAAGDLRLRFLESGVLLRPLGNTVYLMPPYCISDSSLRFAYQTIRKVAHAWRQEHPASVR